MRRVVLTLLILAAVLLTFVVVLSSLIDANQFRPAIESELTKSLGRDVKIGNLKLSILSGTVTAGDLSVADDPAFSHTAFLHAKALTLSIDLWRTLVSRKLSVDGMTIDTPETVLIQVPAGGWNFSSLGTKSSAQPAPASSANANPTLSVRSLKINGARISLTQGDGKPEILDNVGIEVKDFAPGTAFPFSLSARIAGGGDVELEGKAGPIDPADAANTPLTASLKISNLDLAATGAVPPASGIDGVVSVDGTATSNGRTFDMTGKIKAEKLKLAPRGSAARNPLLLDVAVAEDLQQHAGQLSRCDIAIGGVNASLTGTWAEEGKPEVGKSTALKMILSAPAVPISGLMELLPALDIVLPSGSTPEGGTATARLTLSGPTSAVAVSGPVSAHNVRLKGFDLGTKLSPIEKLAGIKSNPNTEIQTFSANLRTAPEGTSLRDIHLVLPSVGEFTGSGTISPSHALDFKMRATIRAGVLISVLAPSNIPFSIVGTSSDPQFRPDAGQLAAEEINRGIQGARAGGLGAGKTAGSVVQGLFGSRKKK